MTTDEIRGWLVGRLPQDWFDGAPEVTIDREEITVVGTLPVPELPDTASDAERAAARRGRVKGFREDTRDKRIEIAREIEHRTDRKVAWGVKVGDEQVLFTHLAVPVMTRLRQPERAVLDTLVDAGVARSRAEALAWCVRLVAEHRQWLGKLRSTMEEVERVRSSPTAAEQSERRGRRPARLPRHLRCQRVEERGDGDVLRDEPRG
jgi:hypothetical protein